MRPQDGRSHGTHAHVNPWFLTWMCCVPNRVDLWMGNRAQKRIDDHLMVFIHGQSCFTRQSRSHKSSGPDTQITNEFLSLIADNALRTHRRNSRTVYDLNAQSAQ